MYSNKIVKLSSSLLIAVFAFACSPSNINTPKQVSSTTTSNTSSSTDDTAYQDIATVSVGTDSSPTSVDLKAGNTDTNLAKGTNFNSQEVKDTLIAYQDTEGAFNDTEEINGSINFSVKAVDAKASADIANDLKNVATGDLRDTIRSVILKDLKAQKVQEKKLEAQLAAIKKREAIDKTLLAKVKHHKGYSIKRSPVISIDNGDGTTTKVSQVEFVRGKITKVNKEARTFDKDKKLIKIIHNFIEKAPNFTIESVRIVTFNSDGSRNVKTESTTKHKNGRVKVVNENKVLDKAGNGTATAVITITDKSGKETTYNVNSTITTGNTQSNVTDPSNPSNAVAINTNVNGTATVTTIAGTTTVDVNTAAQAQAGDTSTTTTPSPVASASPSASTTTSASPSASVDPSSSPTVTASPSATPLPSASTASPSATPSPSASPSA